MRICAAITVGHGSEIRVDGANFCLSNCWSWKRNSRRTVQIFASVTDHTLAPVDRFENFFDLKYSELNSLTVHQGSEWIRHLFISDFFLIENMVGS